LHFALPFQAINFFVEQTWLKLERFAETTLVVTVDQAAK
jgi:hypothetical protein